ncbi:hypothetical protein NE237_002729 [Protea cynaroides]|uniref:Uncharacterized protein n=1 Tax=Protea cynaroides TaxID=273540 RepID=A0A9Q0QRX4_9MAGN|nr:hypothetical protein NE237_002729 [Protea cynaroides]
MNPLSNIDRSYSLLLQDQSQRSMQMTTSILDNLALLSLLAGTPSANAAMPTNKSKERCSNYNLIGYNRSSCYKLVGYPAHYRIHQCNQSKGQVVSSDSKIAPIHGSSTPTLTTDQYQCLLLLFGEVTQPVRANLASSSSQPFNTVLPCRMPDSVIESIPHSTTTPSPSSSSTSPVEDPPPPDPPRHSSRATRPPAHLGDYCCSHIQASSSSP